jgi:ribosome-binding ATPase YchF (GTP1/OBG family)
MCTAVSACVAETTKEWAKVHTWRAEPPCEGPVEVDRVSAASHTFVDIAGAIWGADGGVGLGASDQAAVKSSNCTRRLQPSGARL